MLHRPGLHHSGSLLVAVALLALLMLLPAMVQAQQTPAQSPAAALAPAAVSPAAAQPSLAPGKAPPPPAAATSAPPPTPTSPGAVPAAVPTPPPAVAITGHSVGDPFTVQDVKVDISAASAAAARDQAIADGQRKAFIELYKRLTGSAQMPPKLSNSELESLIQGVEIDEERTSAVRYIASLTVKFRAQATRQFMLGAGVSFADVPTRPVLLLPLVENTGGLVLWEDHTPWRMAWENYRATATLVPVVVPPGDLTDVAMIGGREAVEGIPGPLAAIAARYNAGEVVVAKLTASKGGAPAKAAQVTVIRHYLDGQPSLTDPVHATAKEGEDETALMNRAVTAVMSLLDTARRRGAAGAAGGTGVAGAGSGGGSGMIQGGAQNRLKATVSFARLEEWLEARRRLGQVATIARSDVVTLSRSGADLDLVYYGDPSTLAAALAQRGLLLGGTAPSGPWTISLGAAPPTVVSPAPAAVPPQAPAAVPTTPPPS